MINVFGAFAIYVNKKLLMSHMISETFGAQTHRPNCHDKSLRTASNPHHHNDGKQINFSSAVIFSEIKL